VAQQGQQSVAVILARQVASNLSTPVGVVDETGTIIYFNEAAERIVGTTLAQVGPLPWDQWISSLQPEDLEGNPLTPADPPFAPPLVDHEPAHGRIRITGLDGVKRSIAATAFPLFVRGEEFVGAVAIFWEESDPNDD
jgi:PAS domain-containing protein